MSVENLIRSIKGSYLHFNRVDRYEDSPLVDTNDGAELPLDQLRNRTVTFEKNPNKSLSDYYASARSRTYACCFSLENSEHLWLNYGTGSSMGQIGLEFDFAKLRERLNVTLSSDAALMYGDMRCHQIFSINYGKITYIDRNFYELSTGRLPNPIMYTYIKDQKFSKEREFRISLSATGFGQFQLINGQEMDFQPALALAFDFGGAIMDGTITELRPGPTTNLAQLNAELAQIGIQTV
jgi:hypothetical protein